MLAMSTQYGMVMLLLAAVYAIMAADPLRYIAMLWVAIGEQVLGIAYAVYIYANIGGMTVPQVALQGGINVVIIALFFGFWASLRSRSAAAAA